MRKSFCLGCIFIFLTGLAYGRTQKWLLVQTPIFTIVSAADEDETMAWAIKLEQFRRGMQQLTGVANEVLLLANPSVDPGLRTQAQMLRDKLKLKD